MSGGLPGWGEEKRGECAAHTWPGRQKEPGIKLLSYFFTTDFCPRCWVRMEDVWLGCRQGDCPSPSTAGLSFPGHQQVHLLGEEPRG